MLMMLGGLTVPLLLFHSSTPMLGFGWLIQFYQLVELLNYYYHSRI